MRFHVSRTRRMARAADRAGRRGVDRCPQGASESSRGRCAECHSLLLQLPNRSRRGHQCRTMSRRCDDDERRRMSVASLRRKRRGLLDMLHRPTPLRSRLSSQQEGGTRGSVGTDDALWLSTASSSPWRPLPAARRDNPFSRKRSLRKNRSSIARADVTVRAPVSACARSDRSGSIAETSSTHEPPVDAEDGCRQDSSGRCAAIGNAASVDGDRPLFGDAGPMPFVPSIASDHTPRARFPSI